MATCNCVGEILGDGRCAGCGAVVVELEASGRTWPEGDPDAYMEDHDHGSHRDGSCPGCERESRNRRRLEEARESRKLLALTLERTAEWLYEERARMGVVTMTQHPWEQIADQRKEPLRDRARDLFGFAELGEVIKAPVPGAVQAWPEDIFSRAGQVDVDITGVINAGSPDDLGNLIYHQTFERWPWAFDPVKGQDMIIGGMPLTIDSVDYQPDGVVYVRLEAPEPIQTERWHERVTEERYRLALLQEG
jgi:hypothetical protein